MTDDSVVARAKQGDPEAWRELYRAHAGRLVAWLQTRPTGDTAAAAEDVASQAWSVAAEKIAQFEGSCDDFGGWLFGIARRLSATSRRTWQRRNTRPEDVGDLLDTVPDHGAEVVQQDWVRLVLAQLPPRERAAVGLVDGLGWSPHAAAEVLGVSAVALRVARHRGLRRLARSGYVPGVRVRPAPRG
ncbi:RNA polymerase sigma factor [Aeromicrobium duanguangcaii]|uniref:RNA polymerase sigma factor n=1 Tax=Aeromicrobium duanguangcaii TaxID=2968086 RepID=A0ABY5KF16_9ACTN|nr:RNA polymerase sigma factor [Aeromicrobium duanguangcaii]MCD9154044.1 RNA polymerase sigma factor [Aeromicrobium duanguangcaii]MCL3837779.1 RNA polymerase sigma factor [Aeromicrobium duanguangcaii]UUI68879.1 RNA polymerase sigma factor [Aeromicrobium duanguangcaii]